MNDTVNIIESLESSGVDMIEIGMPFSDPLADGPVIQESSQLALENGMSMNLLFDQLENIRERVTIPLVIMGYLNPVMQYGVERFLKDCKRTGIDGLIIPDLPLAEFKSEYKSLFVKNKIPMVMLITPQTSEERIREIAAASGGFLYVVADSSTTGAKEGISDQQMEYFLKVRDLDLPIPRLIGFGISNAETFRKACDYANGAIIGSAFIRSLSSKDSSEINETVKAFVSTIRY